MPFMSVHTGRLLPVPLSYGDASPSAAIETQQSVTYASLFLLRFPFILKSQTLEQQWRTLGQQE